MTVSNEIWKSIPNCADYEVSNFGRVRTNMERRTKLKDLLDHNVDERFYLKSEKAEKLIKQLIVANIPSENENVDTVLVTKQGTVLERQTDVGATPLF